VIAPDPLITAYYRDNTANEQLINRSGISVGDSTLLTNDPVKLKEFANWCVLKFFYMLNERRIYKTLVHKIEPILEMLNRDITSALFKFQMQYDDIRIHAGCCTRVTLASQNIINRKFYFYTF
jgi:hypothetical protein